MKKRLSSMTRRDFMKLMASSSVAGSVGSLSFMQQAQGAAPAFSDYKAMVCISLSGGNDSFNMIIPSGSTANKDYAAYAKARGDLSVANSAIDLSTIANGADLNSANLSTGVGNPYNVDQNEETAYLKGLYDLNNKGIDLNVNGVMPELAQLITDNKVSVLKNIGTLVNPVTRTAIKDKRAQLPLFLFAHDHQRRQLQTGQAGTLGSLGWAGQIADQFSGINGGSALGLNISYSGSPRLFIGNNSRSLSLKAGKPPRYSQMKVSGGNSDQDRRSFFRALAGKEGSSSSGKVAFDSTNTFSSSDPFKQLYGSMINRSVDTFDLLATLFESTPVTYTKTGSYGENLFDVPSAADLGFSQDISGKLVSQLETVAKMIEYGAKNSFGSGSYNRQIFYVSLGGFDTHASQAASHPKLLRELSLGLWKFQTAMEELGHANKVTTFTFSDFSRTLAPNNTGTDHAWGGYSLVMGGDGKLDSGNFAGGQAVGTSPDLTIDGVDDASNRGRIIPTLAQEQLYATLCHWFGVAEADISRIFPNLANFETVPGNVSSAYLNELFTV